MLYPKIALARWAVAYCKAKWKKHFELINSSKDASRTKAIEMYPHLAEKLSRKKDVNKSDAILIARFYSETRFKEES